MNNSIQDYITKNNTLLIVVDKVRLYEFRDITPRDMLWIYNQELEQEEVSEGDLAYSLEFLLSVCERLLVFANSSLKDELWEVFLKIHQKVQDLILINRLNWKDFLAFVFAAHNKSFSGLPLFMDVPAPILLDAYETMQEFFETQARLMEEAKRG